MCSPEPARPPQIIHVLGNANPFFGYGSYFDPTTLFARAAPNPAHSEERGDGSGQSLAIRPAKSRLDSGGRLWWRHDTFAKTTTPNLSTIENRSAMLCFAQLAPR